MNREGLILVLMGFNCKYVIPKNVRSLPKVTLWSQWINHFWSWLPFVIRVGGGMLKSNISEKYIDWEAGIFLAAPAPDFFPKRLRLLLFSQAAPAPAPAFFSSGSGS